MTYKYSLVTGSSFSARLNDPEEKILEVKVRKDSELIGHAFFGHIKGGDLVCLEEFIRDEYKNQAVRARMKSLAEYYFNKKCLPHDYNADESGK